MAVVAFDLQLFAHRPRVGHELGGLASGDELMFARPPCFQAKHALVGLDNVHADLFHHAPYHWKGPRRCMGGVFMNEYPACFYLFMVEPHHEFHVADPFLPLGLLCLTLLCLLCFCLLPLLWNVNLDWDRAGVICFVLVILV